MGFPGGVGASHLWRLPIEPEARRPGDQSGGKDDERERQQHAGCQHADQQHHAQVHDRRRERDSGGLGAAHPLASEPLRERLGDSGRAVGAADQRGRDRSVAFAEDAVRDIAEERESGDQHDHQPEPLRVPGAKRAVMAGGKKGQHRAGNHGVARSRLHIVFIEPVDEAVKLGPEREESDCDGGAGDGETGLADAGEEADGDRDDGRDRGRRVTLVLELARISGNHDCDGAGGDGRGDDGLPKLAEQARDAAAEAKHRESADPGNAGPGLLLTELPAALDPDQQTADECGRDAERLRLEVQNELRKLDRKAGIALEDLHAELG